MLHIRNLQHVASTAREGQGGPSWRLGARPALGDKHAKLASLSWRNRKYVERMLKSGKSKHGTKEETLRDCENEVTLSSRTHRRGRRPKEAAACPAGPGLLPTPRCAASPGTTSPGERTRTSLYCTGDQWEQHSYDIFASCSLYFFGGK